MNEKENVGFLTVNVRTAGGAIPVPGALVTVTPYRRENDAGEDEAAREDGLLTPYPPDGDAFSEETDEGTGVLYSLRTDVSGKTLKLALPAEDEELSQKPGTIRPYASYNVFVSHVGYYDAESVGVPIFSGITSIQPIELVPLAEYAAPDDPVPDFGRVIQDADDTL